MAELWNIRPIMAQTGQMHRLYLPKMAIMAHLTQVAKILWWVVLLSSSSNGKKVSIINLSSFANQNLLLDLDLAMTNP